MKRFIFSIILLLFFSPLVFSQDTRYIWETEVISYSPLMGGSEFQQRLEKEIQGLVQAGHIAPLRISYGEGANETWWWFNMPYEIIQVLCEALPYISTSLQQQVKTYLGNEISQYPPLTTNFFPPGTGTRREFYNVPSGFWTNNDANGYNRWLGMWGNNLSGVKTGLYALWLYAYRTGDWTYVNNNLNTLRTRAQNLQLQFYEDVSALIGFARIAHHAGQSSWVSETETRILNFLSTTGRNFDSLTGPADLRYSDDSNRTQGGTFRKPGRVSIFEDLTCEMGRFIRDNCITPAQLYISSVETTSPFWFVPQGPLWQGVVHFYWEASSMPPGINKRIFSAEALIKNLSPEQLRVYLGAPQCKYDLDYIWKLIYILRGYSTKAWVDVRGQLTPTKVVLSAVPQILIANGSSTSTVTATVCDANNIPVTTSTATIRFTLTGNAGGTLIGSNPVQAVNGIATITYRSGIIAGTATVTATSSGLTQGEVNIILNEPPQPTITVVYPNGGETWQTQTTVTVIWTWTQTVGPVNIDLSTDGGSSWSNLVSNTANDGSETVTVPNTPSTTCRIRVSETDGTPSDISDNNFSITMQSVPVLQVSKKKLDFGEVEFGKTQTLDFEITNAGGGTLTGTISCVDDWVTAVPENFTAPVTINVTVDNEVLAMKEGVFVSTITINSNGGNADIIVNLTATCVLVKPNPYSPEEGILTFFGSGIVPGKTKIVVYTISGEKVVELSSEENEIHWNGRDENNRQVTSGIYIYIYESSKEKGVGKITVLK